MADILPFKAPKKKPVKARGMCQHGLHKWVVDKESVFDSKQGKLVTRYRCSRCGAIKTKAH